MNHTQGPWSIKVKSSFSGGGVGRHHYLSIDDDTGPVSIVDVHDKVIATVVHREGRGVGFSETACNAHLIEHAPDIFKKSKALVRAIRSGEDTDKTVKDLEQLLSSIEGVVPSPSDVG
jgi:hypothetical protein